MKKRRCKYHKEYFPMEDMLKTNAGWFKDYDAMAKFGLEKSRKDNAKKAKEEHKKLKRKVNINDTRKQHKLTQPRFNRMRVLQELKWFSDRGLEPTCISCQKPLGNDQWCCGHFKTSGGNSRLTYDPKNTYLQHNKNCNMSKSGDIEGYKIGLFLRFGDEEGFDIIKYCEENRHPKKWTGIELEEIRLNCNAEIRKLEKELEQ